MARIQESVQDEAKAARDEVVAKELLQEQLDSLCQEHDKTKKESEAKREEVLALAHANKIAQEIQTARKETDAKFAAEKESTMKLINERRELISSLEIRQKNDMAQAIQQLKQAREGLTRTQAALTDAKERASRSVKEVLQVESDYKQALETAGTTPEELVELIKEARNTVEQLKEEQKVHSEKEPVFDEKNLNVDHNLSVEEMNAEIKQFLQGTYHMR
jgi:chromosome segregation ATPase